MNQKRTKIMKNTILIALVMRLLAIRVLANTMKTLEIPKNATQNEIKNQCRRLVKEWHPDKNPDPKTKEKMAEINKAYEVLSDKERRNNYDKYFDALSILRIYCNN